MRLSRYLRRFGGAGTIVTLDDGRAFTAAHCIAAVDGRPGTLVAAGDGGCWQVRHRWSPRGCDLAVLTAVSPARAACIGARPSTLATRRWLRPGVDVVFYAHTASGFRRRRARVIATTATTAIADVLSRAGIGTGDSGGPVLVGGTLVGVVTHRAGPPRSARASGHLVFTRLDLPLMRVRIARS